MYISSSPFTSLLIIIDAGWKKESFSFVIIYIPQLNKYLHSNLFPCQAVHIFVTATWWHKQDIWLMGWCPETQTIGGDLGGWLCSIREKTWLISSFAINPNGARILPLDYQRLWITKENVAVSCTASLWTFDLKWLQWYLAQLCEHTASLWKQCSGPIHCTLFIPNEESVILFIGYLILQLFCNMLSNAFSCCGNFIFYFGNLASGKLTTEARNRKSSIHAHERIVWQNYNKLQKFYISHIEKHRLLL